MKVVSILFSKFVTSLITTLGTGIRGEGQTDGESTTQVPGGFLLTFILYRVGPKSIKRGTKSTKRGTKSTKKATRGTEQITARP